MKLLKSTTKPLRLKPSLSFEKAVISYFVFKSKNLKDIEHAKSIIDRINGELKEIQINKKHLSQKVHYRNSKNLQRFIIEKHTVFFRIDLQKEELQVMYFVPAKRVKKKLTK